MNKTNYKQYDTRWAKLGYPKSPYFIEDCGCGEVAICNCIIEMEKYESQTPKTIQPYCVQYAAPNGNGTYFSGIPAMMKHYGMTEVKEHSDMNSLWKELAKGDRVAIYLMGSRKGGSKGIHWTSGGHFVCSTGYKVKDGKHYLYVKDSYSASKDRNGWISYEDNMRGDVSRVWSGKIKKAKAYVPKTAYSGKIPETTVKEGSTGRDVKRVQKLLNWRFNYKLKLDGICGENTVKAIKHFQKFYSKQYGLKIDGIFGKACIKAAKKIVKKYADRYAPDPLQSWYDAMVTQFNWSKNQIYHFNDYPTVANSEKEGTCITYPSVALQRIGLLPVGGYFYYYPNYKKLYGNKLGREYVASHPEIFDVSYPDKTIKQLWNEGKIRKGDIVDFTDPARHTMVFMGFDSKNNPLFNTMGHTRGLNITMPSYANSKVKMLVRIKKISK